MFRRLAMLSFTVIALCLISPAQATLGQRQLFSPPLPGMPADHNMSNSLSGKVVTSDNKPVKDVHVELRTSSGSTVNSAYTNASGDFEFAMVYAGTYNVVASSGVNQAQERIDVGMSPSAITLRLPVSNSATDGNGTASVSVAAYKVPVKARQALQKAREASMKGKKDEAQKQVAKALEIYPKYADALALRGILKMDANDVAGAKADLQEAINDDENCGLAYLVMGSILNLESKFDDAVRILTRGESLSPNSWQAYFEMGKALNGKAQYEAALREFDRAQTLAPDASIIHVAKARALFGIKSYADAVSELQAYLTREPQGPHSEEVRKMLAQAQTHVQEVAQ